MSELLERKDRKYISIRYIDTTGQRRELSTGYEKTNEGRKQARSFQKTFESKLKERKESAKYGIIPKESPTLYEAFQHFLKNNDSRNFKTIYEYNGFFKRLFEYLPSSRPCQILNKLTAEDFLNHVKKLKLAQNTKHNIYKNLVHFIHFLGEYNYIQPFIINKDLRIKPGSTKIIVFDSEEIFKILRTADKSNSNIKTLIYLLVYTGLRPSDILTISAERINLKEQTLEYYSPKLKKNKVIPFHPSLLSMLKERLKEINEGPIIIYSNLDNAAKSINRILKKAELKKNGYNARTFRKTFLNEGYKHIPFDIMSDLAGHSIKTADRYYKLFSLKEARGNLGKIYGDKNGDKPKLRLVKIK